MAVSVKNQIVLITGASAGIGKACAEVFAREGAKLILMARRTDRLKAIAGDLQKRYSCRCLCIKADVANRKETESAVSGLPEEWSAVDILINNAGLARGIDKLHEASVDDWEEMIDTNIKGLLYVSRAVVPGMVKRKKGHIINLGSIAGHEVYPGGNVYCATKHAVLALSKGLMIDLVDTPVRVSSVDPGMVETEFSIVRFRNDEARAKKVYEHIQALRPEDVAETILFVATRPPHVNVSEVIIFPAHQAGANFVHRSNT